MQFATEFGVTQKSAWFMLQRLREACGFHDEIDKLRGRAEIDECFIGGKEHTSTNGKSSGLGAVQSGKLPCSGCANATKVGALLRR